MAKPQMTTTVHVRVNDETLDAVDRAAGELGLGRSDCIRLLLVQALNNMVFKPLQKQRVKEKN
jgi:antitoxin component of RelBE/YafQ-DinJ toxin-antitoxin module